VQLKGLGQLKNLVTSLGIEPVTFRPVAKCLNQLRYRVPWVETMTNKSVFSCLPSHQSNSGKASSNRPQPLLIHYSVIRWSDAHNLTSGHMSIGCRLSYHKVTNPQDDHHQYRTIVPNGDISCVTEENHFAEFTVWSDKVTFKLNATTRRHNGVSTICLWLYSHFVGPWAAFSVS
jgi:hypothetical protein